MLIPDHDTFGMYMRLDLIAPTNIAQHATLWDERRKAKRQSTAQTLYAATLSMQTLNRWARTSHGDIRNFVYWLKRNYLRLMYLFGHIAAIDAEQQALSCHRCFRGRWHYGRYDEEGCWSCNGTGIYKRILLWKFTIRAGGELFEFHSPASLIRWDMPEAREVGGVELEDLPLYKEIPAASVNLSTWELQEHMLRVAVAVEAMMWTEHVELNPLGRALRHDVREIANWLTRPFYRMYQRWQARREEAELPF